MEAISSKSYAPAYIHAVIWNTELVIQKYSK